MKRVAAIGSCLSALTAAMLVGDYRWVRVNNASVDRSDLFVKYFLRQEPAPSRAFVEMLLAVRPEHVAAAKDIFDRMFRETAGLVEQPVGTRPLFETLERERLDVLLLDNLFDTGNIKCTYRSLDGRLDFEFNFPLHWCERAGWMEEGAQWSGCLDPAESARNWAEIVRHLQAVQPAARIVFICTPSSTFEADPERQARADAFEPAFRAALGPTAVEIVPQLAIPRDLSKLPDDPEHFDLRIYRALAGRVFTHALSAPPGEHAADAG